MIHEESQRVVRSDAQRNLERVLRAVYDLFVTHGADVTMEEVARSAGVGIGTIYRRFGSKEELFAAVSHTACADTCNLLRAASRASADPLARLRALALAQLHHGGQLARGHNPASDEAVEPGEVVELLHELLAEAIADGQRQNLIRDGNPRLLAAFCLELLSLRALRRMERTCPVGADELADEALRFVFYGLGQAIP